MATPNIKSLEIMERLLAELSRCGNVTRACEVAGISRTTAYAWRHEDAAFADAWDGALALGAEGLEDEARRRAYEGVEVPIYQMGQLVGSRIEYSDAILMRLLEAHKPDKYRRRTENQNTQQFLGKDGQPVDASAVVNITIGGGG